MLGNKTELLAAIRDSDGVKAKARRIERRVLRGYGMSSGFLAIVGVVAGDARRRRGG